MENLALIHTCLLIKVIAFTLFGFVAVKALSNNKSLLAHSHSFKAVQGQFCEAEVFDSKEKLKIAWHIINVVEF